MPSVGMRRSTRIFVPKSVVKDADLGKVLRSGKRLASESAAGEGKQGRGNEDGHFRLVDNSDEIRVLPCYKSNGWREVIPEQDVDVTDMDFDMEDENLGSQESEDVSEDITPDGSDESRYKNVYDRKRRRSPEGRSRSGSGSSSQVKEERMHGTVYVRKKKSRKTGAALSSSSEFLRRMETSEDNVCNGEVIGTSDSKVEVVGRDCSTGLFPGATLDVTVDSSPASSLRFTGFLVSVLKFMRSSVVTLPGLAAFTCCEPIVDVFSRHGVHFKIGLSPRNSFRTCAISSGLCQFFGEQTFVPLFWLEFSATPQSFRNLHYMVFFRSLYIPHVLSCSSIGLLSRTGEDSIKFDEDTDQGKSLVCVPTEPSLPQNNFVGSGNSSLEERNVNFGFEGFKWKGRKVSTRRAVSRNIRRKRSSLRSKRANNFSSTRFGGVRHFNAKNQVRADYSAKNNHGSADLDMYGSLEGGYLALPAPVSTAKQADSVQRDVLHNIKEVKSTLVGARHNAESQSCNANVLVIESDRCYREEGVTIMLEFSPSKVWYVAIKAQGVTKYRHLAHEDEVIRPNTTNRFTHAVIWTAENGWKLEFCDRMDWFTFKELHKECVRINLELNSAKTIPVPGVRKVLNYDDCECVPFLRPDSYITVHSNEVARALVKKTANYDIDQEDEQWLDELNSGLCNGDNGGVDILSAEKFEELIDILEKAAYRNPIDVSDESKLVSLCSDLGRNDVVSAVYQYWLKKRKQKHAALLMVFECQPPRKAHSPLDNVLRKKRSFKKQASQNGRAKQRYYCEAQSTEEEQVEDMKRVEEAQNKAKEALTTAVLKRKRAQTLMDNADLATYLAAMALKIAETVQLAELSDSSEYSLPGSC